MKGRQATRSPPTARSRRWASSLRADHSLAQPSGGEQLRVAIDRTVVERPDVLLRDEPTGAPDSHRGALVLEVLTPAEVSR